MKKLSLNAFTLRCLALACMLLDHLWASIVPGNAWMNDVGRLAFPIFAFQVAEGYFHTSNFKQYAKRLLLFGLLSEIPFNWFVSGSWFYPFHQNVLFTLLLGLVALRMLKSGKSPMLAALAAAGLCLLGTVAMTDYGGYGVAMVVLFGLARGRSDEKLLQLIGMVLINIVLMEGRTIPVFGIQIPIQGFAVLALLPIWLYNGQKGGHSRVLQTVSYLFYPVHMFILAGIRYFL